MSEFSLARVKLLYEEADQLNRKAVAHLSAAESPLLLSGLFQRKGEIARELEELAVSLQESRDTEQSSDLQLAFEAQKAAAMSEVHLAEQLSLWRQRHRELNAAYGKFEPMNEKKSGGLDRAG